MNVVSVTQNEAGMLTVFFDTPDAKISMVPIKNFEEGTEPPRIDLTFALEAAKQLFDGLAAIEMTPEVNDRIMQFSNVLYAAYFVPQEEKRKHLN
jgi:hypothetical protein